LSCHFLSFYVQIFLKHIMLSPCSSHNVKDTYGFTYFNPCPITLWNLKHQNCWSLQCHAIYVSCCLCICLLPPPPLHQNLSINKDITQL
jgi:hypothetical protein